MKQICHTCLNWIKFESIFVTLPKLLLLFCGGVRQMPRSIHTDLAIYPQPQWFDSDKSFYQNEIILKHIDCQQRKELEMSSADVICCNFFDRDQTTPYGAA